MPTSNLTKDQPLTVQQPPSCCGLSHKPHKKAARGLFCLVLRQGLAVGSSLPSNWGSKCPSPYRDGTSCPARLLLLALLVWLVPKEILARASPIPGTHSTNWAVYSLVLTRIVAPQRWTWAHLQGPWETDELEKPNKGEACYALP